MLEVLLVMALIAMTAGFIGINIRQAVVEQNFRSEVQLLEDQLNLAQDMMLLQNVEAAVEFSIQDGKRVVAIVPKGPIGNLSEKMIDFSNKTYSTIEEFQFDDMLKDVIKEPPFELEFLSRGFVMSQGILQVKGAGYTEYIHLKGYPEQIKAQVEEPDEFRDVQQEADIREKITQQMVQDVQSQTL